MAKCIKYCIKRMLKTADENPTQPFTIIDAYNRKIYDSPDKCQRVINAQNAAHISTQWKFIMFEIAVDERDTYVGFDPDDKRCQLIKPDTFKGNRTQALKNKSHVDAEERRKEESRKKAQREFEERERALMAKFTPEQMRDYVALKLKEEN